MASFNDIKFRRFYNFCFRRGGIRGVLERVHGFVLWTNFKRKFKQKRGIMKGSLVSYSLPWTLQEYIGIVIDSLDGFHARKSWSSKRTFIDRPMIRIYWLNEPDSKPISARKRILENWKYDNKFGSTNGNNIIIDEFTDDNWEEEWYFPDEFEIVREQKL